MVISGMSAIIALSLSLELLYGQARVGMERYKDHSVREEWDPKGAELEVETVVCLQGYGRELVEGRHC
jgi:hypothetical protein